MYHDKIIVDNMSEVTAAAVTYEMFMQTGQPGLFIFYNRLLEDPYSGLGDDLLK